MKSICIKITVLFFILLCTFSSNLFANDNSVNLGTVLVTGEPIIQDEYVTDFGGSVSEVGKSQISDSNTQELTSTLRQVPGVNISRYNYVGSYGGADGGAVYIRGQGAGRPGSEIRVYKDGVPAEAGIWSHPVLDIANIDHADNISVFKGPQPELFGDSFGAINIETRRKKTEGFETETDLSGGSFGTFIGNINHGGKEGPFDYYAGASYKRSDGSRPHSAGELGSYMGRLGYDLNSDWHVSYILNTTSNWAQDPGAEGTPVPIRNRFDTQSYDNVIRFDQNSKNAHGFALFYFQNGKIDWAKDSLNSWGPVIPGTSKTEWNNFGVRSLETFNIRHWALTAGMDIESNGGTSKDVDTGGSDVSTPFTARYTLLSPVVALGYTYEINDSLKLKPSVGLRYYFHDRFGEDTSPDATIILEGKDWSTHVSYSRGIHYPGLYVLSMGGDVNTLKPEIMNHFEVGGSWNIIQPLTAKLNLFYDRTNEMLEIGPMGVIFNGGKGTIYGSEISADYHPIKWIRTFSSLTLMKAEPVNFPRVPTASASIGTEITPVERWTLNLDVQYVGKQTVGDTRSDSSTWTTIGDYTIANAKLSYQMLKKDYLNGTIFVSAENFTNRKYSYWPGYPMPGASILAGTNLKF